MGQFAATVNATEYPPHLKHKVIFETFGKLAPSEAMLLINNHDPVPLRFQFGTAAADGPHAERARPVPPGR